ncbi:MAG: SUF system Fe-S cluster assembly protein [Gammaproteobacteria bacterium]|nr:SUF system Fe-S cluster assembly protein [Gammaproteobacteria bacterium]
MSDLLKDIKIKAVNPFSADRRQVDPATSASETHAASSGALRERAIAALRTIYDPEIPVNIYELGLIYTLDVNEADGTLYVEMTLTAPGCPVAQTFPGTVEARLREVEGVEEVTVKLVWEPTWTQDRMTEAARLQLGLL